MIIQMAYSKNYILLVFLFSFSLLHIDSCTAQNVKAAYWYPGNGIAASDIESSLFTHLFCAFADLDNSTYQAVISSSNAPYFASFTTDVQGNNPSVITLLSIGGGNSNASDFATMASSSSYRQSFINSTITLARSNGFSGLDLDWEYPDTDEKMTNLGLLLQEWRTAVEAEASSSGNAVLLLTAAVYFTPHYWSPADYPVSAMAGSLDWINVMAYDFFGPSWSSTTGPLAALYDPGNGLCGDIGVSAWIQAGMPAASIVLGFPFYGRAFALADPNDHGYFAPFTGPATSVTSDSGGALDYNQITTFIADSGATKVYNSTVVSDYCYSGTTWITYDDTDSISTKVTYAKGRGLRGYFAWEIGGDDNWVLSQQASSSWGSFTLNVLSDISDLPEKYSWRS